MKGVYVLVISVNGPMRLNIGSLGLVRFETGTYAYVGSAQNNLEKRIARHLKKGKPGFWHIDYLLESHSANIASVFVKNAQREEECVIAKRLGDFGEEIEGFGCSDCRCSSHLFMISECGFLSEFMDGVSLPLFKEVQN